MLERPFQRPRYDSNDWIEPIIDRAIPIFSRFTKEEAVNIATAVELQLDAGQPELPWVTVFQSDNLNDALRRLTLAMKTPDFRTPAFDPKYRLAVDEVREILDKADAYGMFGCHAACFLIEAAGKEERFRVYSDKGRMFPQYTGDWEEALTKQFGEERISQAKKGTPELFDLLAKDRLLAAMNDKSMMLRGESTFDYIERVSEFFGMSLNSEGELEASLESLIRANKLLQGGFDEYRIATYESRGLQYIKSK
ncbi:MAG: hypothetical protein A2152_01025 [Candidatus Levybacteria bacterium RBG_16_35_6]|nr:MAG: hypothetical protein A2152_01025 [Candidatus Levybacteria bacterium RBG_16_35_6]